jgi:hypothetical protein
MSWVRVTDQRGDEVLFDGQPGAPEEGRAKRVGRDSAAKLG